MQKIIEFLIQNWRLLLEVACALIALVLFICRKKPVKVVDAISQYILTYAPKVINEAELTEYKNEDKLAFATGLMLNLLKTTYGLEEKDLYKLVGFIHQVFEDILSTPQKKER